MRGKMPIILDGALGFILGVMLSGSLFLLVQIPVYPKSIILGMLFIILFLPVIEELLKYLPLQSSLFKKNYIVIGFAVGLGFALIESFTYIYSYFTQYGSILFTYRIGATLLHIATGGLMGFFVSKRKGWLGLLLAIMLHSLFNFYIEFK